MIRRCCSILLTLVLLCSCVLFASFSVSSAENEALTDESVSASESVEITGSKYVAVGKAIRLKANQDVKWKSSNDAIASVSKNGRVKGLKPGKARITATASSGKKKSWTVIVKAHPVQKVTVEAKTKRLDLNGNKRIRLKASAFPEDAAQSFTWKSSNPAVATVSAIGKVTATGVGKVKITATATDGSKKSRSVTLRVTDSGNTTPEPSVTPEPSISPEPSPSPVPKNYRALLIGEESFVDRVYDRDLDQFVYVIDPATRNAADMNHMASMLGRISGPDGGKYQVTAKKNADYDTIHSLIQSTFADATDNDVSLFFIATHGDSASEGELLMPFLGDVSDADAVESYKAGSKYNLSFATLASWLKNIPGEVIVILESCGSGSSIYSSAVEENGINSAFSNAAAVQAASYNTSAVVSAASNAFSGYSVNTGELRLNKFYVLAAARYQEDSWGYEQANPDDSYNCFTDWLIQGVGDASSSPADANHNGLITLTELFDYIRKENNLYNGTYPAYQQHVQRYPVGSQYELFRVN